MSTDTFPCAFKRHVEQRAINDLHSISEKVPIPSWKKPRPLDRDKAFQDSEDDLGTLMHKLFVNGNDNIRCSSSKTPLCAWQICISAKQHTGDYFKHEEALLATKKNISVFSNEAVLFTPPRCHRSNLITAETSRNIVERFNVKQTRAQSAPLYVEKNEHFQDGGKQKSPLCSFKFYHCNLSSYHIKSYCEQITNVSIKNHIYSWLRENAKILKAKKSSVKKSATQATCRSTGIPKSSIPINTFRISKHKSVSYPGYLKVGPCPRLSEKEEVKRADSNKCSTSRQSEKQKDKLNMARQLQLEQKRRRMEVTTIASLRSHNNHPFRGKSISPDPDWDEHAQANSRTENNEGPLKKVQLRWCKCSDSPRVVPKPNGRVHTTKTKVR